LSELAREKWERALRCLDSAALLIQAGDPDSAVSRAA
jgi:HEPN domain-containing protein